MSIDLHHDVMIRIILWTFVSFVRGSTFVRDATLKGVTVTDMTYEWVRRVDSKNIIKSFYCETELLMIVVGILAANSNGQCDGYYVISVDSCSWSVLKLLWNYFVLTHQIAQTSKKEHLMEAPALTTLDNAHCWTSTPVQLGLVAWFPLQLCRSTAFMDLY